MTDLYSLAMNEFKDQLEASERDKVTALVAELRALAVKGQAGDASVTAEQIKEQVGKTQTASLGLFQKVYEKKNAENNANASSSSESTADSTKTDSTEGEKKN